MRLIDTDGDLNEEIWHMRSEIDGTIYDTEESQIVTTIVPCMPDDTSKVLMKTKNGEYFTCKALRVPEIDELKSRIEFFGILPITLDDADDYIMEFYPEEYDRIKPILDAEREKSAKNKKE